MVSISGIKAVMVAACDSARTLSWHFDLRSHGNSDLKHARSSVGTAQKTRAPDPWIRMQRRVVRKPVRKLGRPLQFLPDIIPFADCSTDAAR